MAEERHLPVMVQEVLEVLDPRAGETQIDGTLGAGGHASAVLERMGWQGRFLGLDRDGEMMARGEAQVRRQAEAAGAGAGLELRFAARPYEQVESELADIGWPGADGILLDLGLNSMQLDDPQRGFSFLREGPLDGRYDRTKGRTMGDLVNMESTERLAELLYSFGDERNARCIARAIDAERRQRPIETTAQLAALVWNAYPAPHRHGRTHPATKTFQALRIAVNDELGAVERGLQACIDALRPNGRLACLSFHSGEDRIVKNLFRKLATPAPDPSNVYTGLSREPVLFELLARGGVECSDEEAATNPRARSARLRAIRRRSADEAQ